MIDLAKLYEFPRVVRYSDEFKQSLFKEPRNLLILFTDQF